ncbi:MAG TPA: DNA mismatch repair endonuclease MutL [Oscillospiraceae bacterium]|nr:DNA mismatch repair endonuclease MutL [Oscillospiraceae bacterium]
MPNIHILSPHVADLIAAGEVVERPGSAAKELLENAVDAGASAVTVEIRRGGMEYLRVTDDGCGIAPEDVKTAFLRHATSKLRDARDLEAIGTLGFRGEALAAISAVSRVDILTRARGTDEGSALSLEGGLPGEVVPAGCPEGTTIIVRDLFFNTPARLKFMKRDAAEAAFVQGVVQKVALSRPEVSVKLIRDGAELFHTPGDGQLRSVVYALLGRDFALGLLPVSGGNEEASVTGFTSKPNCCRGTRAGEHFFVNGRYIQSRTMTAALEEAYKNARMVGKFPACVLHLSLPLSRLDVNVHPAKTEVKFVSDRAVFDAVYHAVLSAIGGEAAPERVPEPVSEPGSPAQAGPAAPRGDFFKTMSAEEFRKTAAAWDPPRVPERTSSHRAAPSGSPSAFPQVTGAERSSLPVRDGAGLGSMAGPEKHASAAPVPEAPASAPASPSSSLPSAPEEDAQTSLLPGEGGSVPWRLAGEVLDTYIVVERGDEVFFIDKHAAHERLHFDRLRREGFSPMGQRLLTPLLLRPSGRYGAALLEALPLLSSCGFEIEEFGSGVLAVRQVPADVTPGEAEDALYELAAFLTEGGRPDAAAARDALLASVACKASVRGGEKSDARELSVLAEAVMEGRVRHCPHGRTVAVVLTRKELERRFGRA